MTAQNDAAPTLQLYREDGLSCGSFDFVSGETLGLQLQENHATVYWSAGNLGRMAAINAIAPLVEKGDRLVLLRGISRGMAQGKEQYRVRQRIPVLPQVSTAARLSRIQNLELIRLRKTDARLIVWSDKLMHDGIVPQMTVTAGSIEAAEVLMRTIGIGQETVGNSLPLLVDAVSQL